MTTIQNILNLKIDNLQFFTDILKENLEKYKSNEIEIESRFGTIIDKFTKERLPYDAYHPVILDKSPNYEFTAGVNKRDFKNFQTLFMNEKFVHTSDTSRIHGKNRIIVCDGKEIMMKKTKLKTLDIFLPNCTYDMRICVSTEQEIHEFKQKNSFSRERERDSYTLNDLRFDLTTITPYYRNQRKEQKPDPYYEIETEMVRTDGDLDAFIKTSFNLTSFFEYRK